jgi:hypothetical protein
MRSVTTLRMLLFRRRAYARQNGFCRSFRITDVS